MKFFVLFVSAFAVAAMAQRQNNQINNNIQNEKQQIPILSLEQNLNHDGEFNYAFETGDGTRVQQNGQLRQSSFDPKNVGEAVQGAFSYQGDDGQTYALSYTADENGYRPVGDFLPTPPPIPPAIAKAVEYLKSLPPHKDNQ
ncbi:hypothetical protein PVAND_004956 [Polypedilum vanderplanki]|uniref:Uncharacterized protein n=1 Tax=Polypedilum vanderplanki TaxID=319348 RepID=A0A9J6BZA9_POLVA|nr:hypothetical protein PVAND_004956 [Polypedilum vanderplanki]